MVSCADFIRFVDADFVCTREVNRTSRRPPRPPSLPLVSVNTIVMQEVDKRFYDELELVRCEKLENMPLSCGVEESWRSLNGVES